MLENLQYSRIKYVVVHRFSCEFFQTLLISWNSTKKVPKIWLFLAVIRYSTITSPRLKYLFKEIKVTFSCPALFVWFRMAWNWLFFRLSCKAVRLRKVSFRPWGISQTSTTIKNFIFWICHFLMPFNCAQVGGPPGRALFQFGCFWFSHSANFGRSFVNTNSGFPSYINR